MDEPTQNDGELLSAYVEKHDMAAFEELYRRYSGVVYSVCLRHLNGSVDAEDAATACFSVLIRKAGSLIGRSSLAGWFYSCARVSARKAGYLQRKRQIREIEVTDALPEAVPADEGKWNAIVPILEAEIADLPSSQREVLVLQYYQGMSVSQIAEKLGRPRGTVATWTRRGLERLRERLGLLGRDLSVEDMAAGFGKYALIVPLPASLAAKLALLGETGTVTGNAGAIAGEVVRSMFLAKAKAAIMIAAGAVVLGGAAISLMQSAGGERTSPVNSLFNPADHPLSAAALDVGSGTITIDTGDGTRPPVLAAGAITNTGFVVTNQSGRVVLALMNYDRIAVARGVTVNVNGNLGLVLGSRGSFDFAGTLLLTGTAGRVGAASNHPAGGEGGAGAEGGGRNASCASAPPSAARGAGGTGGLCSNVVDGVGFGGGQGLGMHDYPCAGGGGGYGGSGGGSHATVGLVRLGGNRYGDEALTDLFGGSGGGGSCAQFNHDADPAAGGGGGGGAVELVALGTMTFNGTINALGGNGACPASGLGAGGGSGGAVILAARRLSASGGLVDCSGGAGGGDASGQWTLGGGGGGGGRIAFYYKKSLAIPEIRVAGGAGGAGGTQYGSPAAPAGSNGTYSVSAAFLY